MHFRAGFAQVGNVAAAPVHQADQTAAGVEVLGVAVHVLGEMANAGGEARDLGLGGADIFVVRAQLGNRGKRVLRGGGLRHDSGEGGLGLGGVIFLSVRVGTGIITHFAGVKPFFAIFFGGQRTEDRGQGAGGEDSCLLSSVHCFLSTVYRPFPIRRTLSFRTTVRRFAGRRMAKSPFSAANFWAAASTVAPATAP